MRLLQAQEFSREKNFTAALPIWEELAKEPASPSLPRSDILLQLARAYDELKQYPQAAVAYRTFLDDAGTQPGNHPKKQTLSAQARLAVCLQASNQLLAATDAWKALLSQAPDGTPEQEAAIESLGLIYAQGGPAQESSMVDVFSKLLATFPLSPLRAMAAFTVGNAHFKNRDYKEAEPLLLNARAWDAKTWLQPATQRLVLGAYGMKDTAKAIAYVKDYDAIPAPTDPQAAIAARLPAALFYWLAENARQSGHWEEAEADYIRVTQHPDPGDLLAGAWWQLGEVQAIAQGMDRRRGQLRKISVAQARRQGRDDGAADVGQGGTRRGRQGRRKETRRAGALAGAGRSTQRRRADAARRGRPLPR